MNETQKGNDLLVFISTDESNYSEYLKVADCKEIVKGLVTGNRRYGERAQRRLGVAGSKKME